MILLFIVIRGHSQNADSCLSGVYVTQDDFVHNRLSHQINTGEKGNKIDFTFPADLSLAVKITTPDTTLKFEPGTIYGYNNCGKVSRYFKGGKELNAQEDYYELEEVGNLVIYSSILISDAEIFYSLDLTSPIHRLTLQNLKSDFKNYPDFLSEAKKINKKPGEGLGTRDAQGNFQINQIYEETIKNK